MSLITDDHSGVSMEMDFKNDFSKLKLIVDKIKPLNNKLFGDVGVFYLTDENDNYLAHAEFDNIDKKKISLISTYSTVRGFYELLFRIILAKTEINMIFGGSRQSLRSIKSWKKQLSKFKKKVYNTQTKEIEEFDSTKEIEYWTTNPWVSKKYLVGISESDNNIKTNFSDADDFLMLRESRGRTTVPTNQILVGYYGLDNTDVESMLKYMVKLNDKNKL